MSQDATQTAAPVAAGRAGLGAGQVPWRGAGVAMAITFSLLQMLNEIGAMMAIPLYGSMGAELHLTPAQTSWALLATTIFGAASVALGSKAGDLFGHRRIMIICVAGIIVGYVISATAPNFALLVIGRALVGITAGQALCVGIMNDRFNDGNRRKAIAIIAAGQAIGVFGGFALGGLLLALGGTWRTAFWVGFALTLVSGTAFLIWGKDSDAKVRNAGKPKPLNVGGVLLLGIGLTFMCIGISQSTTWGVFTAKTILFTLGGLVLLAVSFFWESRAVHPLLDVRHMFSRKLGPAYLSFISLGVCSMLMFNFIMGWAQTPSKLASYGFGWTPLEASLLFLPLTVGGLIAAPIMNRLGGKVSPSAILIVSGLILVAAFVWLRFMLPHPWAILVGVFFYGITYTTLFSVSIAVIAAQAGVGKGAGTASVYVAVALASGSLGTGIYAAIAGANTDPKTGTLLTGAYDTGMVVAAVGALVPIIAGVLLRSTKPVQLSAAH
jgi:MFS family permease